MHLSALKEKRESVRGRIEGIIYDVQSFETIIDDVLVFLLSKNTLSVEEQKIKQKIERIKYTEQAAKA